MSQPRKIDVKNHLSARGRSGHGPFQPLSESNPTESLTAQLITAELEVEVNTAAFAEDFSGEHSSQGPGIAPAAPIGPRL